MSATQNQAGFSLVEIMVALVIGMLATIVVLQVFTYSESRNRTAAGSADAQSTGVMTFYQLQSNIMRAGYGLNSVGLFDCRVTWKVASGNDIAYAVTLAPVSINPVNNTGGVITPVIPAGDANTDTLLIMYGNADGQPQGNKMITSAAPVYTMQMPSAFAVGDRVIAAPDTCAADLSINRVTAVDVTNVTTEAGANGTSLFNLGPGPNGVASAAAASNGPTILAYAVRGGNLTVCDYTLKDCSDTTKTGDATFWVPMADKIVSMRAVYWKDISVPMDGVPDAAGHDQTLPATGCNWARATAINLALVSRSDEYVKDNGPDNPGIVTTTARNVTAPAVPNAPTWTQNAVAPLVAATGALGPDTAVDEPWKHYRYKTFEATIPIRNVAWMGVPTGC